MKRFELAFPCRADFGAMVKTAGGRFCDECEEVVHDLSAMNEGQARALLARTPRDRVCVRYVYDRQSGEVVFGAEAAERSRIIPEHRLLERLKSRLVMAATIAAPLLVEACGGNDGNYDRSGDQRHDDNEDDAYADEWPEDDRDADEDGHDPAAAAGGSAPDGDAPPRERAHPVGELEPEADAVE